MILIFWNHPMNTLQHCIDTQCQVQWAPFARCVDHPIMAGFTCPVQSRVIHLPSDGTLPTLRGPRLGCVGTSERAANRSTEEEIGRIHVRGNVESTFNYKIATLVTSISSAKDKAHRLPGSGPGHMFVPCNSNGQGDVHLRITCCTDQVYENSVFKEKKRDRSECTDNNNANLLCIVAATIGLSQ